MNRRSLLAFAATTIATPARAGLKPDTRIRLLSGSGNTGVRQAALEITTGEDWKTYWRMPGDAGIPPNFDWSGSANAKAIDVLFPAPHRYNDAAGESIGYKGRVAFPLMVTAENPALPVDLKLKIFFAICKDICIPSELEAAVHLDGSGRDDGVIANAWAEVPKPGKLIASVTALAIDGKPAIRVVLDAPQAETLDMFVEGAEPAYIGAPNFVEGGYVLKASGVKEFSELRGKMLRFTVVGGTIRLEQSMVVA